MTKIEELLAEAQTQTAALRLADKRIEELLVRVARLEAALKKSRVFIEYARYELEDGKAKLGDQFPKKDDADEAMARINAVLAAGGTDER